MAIFAGVKQVFLLFYMLKGQNLMILSSGVSAVNDCKGDLPRMNRASLQRASVQFRVPVNIGAA
jgi:hypothetical protein